MDTDWGDDHVYSGAMSPTSTDDAYINNRTTSMTRDPFHRRDSSPGPSTSQPSFAANGHLGFESVAGMPDFANDSSISPLDPRRFTPTLHASLVSEILSLRRDLESKVEIIDSLEANLHSAKSEAETLQETLAKDAKENRILKKQLQAIEGGSSSAVAELTQERDDAWENVAESRKRIEQLQKRAKTQDEQAERTQRLWNLDKQKWEEERRKLDTKVHIVEGRLKAVLTEVANSQGMDLSQDGQDVQSGGSEQRSPVKRPATRTSILSHGEDDGRPGSVASTKSQDNDVNDIRYSILSLVNGNGGIFASSNLADELAFDEEEEEDEEGESEESDYPYDAGSRPGSRDTTLLETRPASTISQNLSIKARKVLGMSWEGFEAFDSRYNSGHIENVEQGIGVEADKVPRQRLEYRDAGVQYTPPPSPKIDVDSTRRPSSPTEPVLPPTLSSKSSEVCDNGVQTEIPEAIKTAPKIADKCVGTATVRLTNAGCQTAADVTQTGDDTPNLPAATISSTTSTQTEEAPMISSPKQPTQFEIPMITVQPPKSNPPSPRNSVVLPPQTKNASCQTTLKITAQVAQVASISTQTEEIRVDKRLKTVASLLPSAILDHPNDNNDVNKTQPEVGMSYPIPVPPKSAKRQFKKPQALENSEQQEPTIQAYPGNNDNGPLVENLQNGNIRRPFRSSSLFAGFESISDEDAPPVAEDTFSDEGMMSRPMASYKLRYGKLVSKTSYSGLSDDSLLEMEGEDENDFIIKPDNFSEQAASKSGLQRSRAYGRSTRRPPPRTININNMASSSKEPNIRRAAMISNSSAAHQNQSRPRSPSAPDLGSTAAAKVPPPFPVPMRLSSRKIPTSASEGARSPTPSGRNATADHSKRELPLRKIRSAAAVTKTRNDDSSSYNYPPTISTPSSAPETPRYPSLDEVSIPRYRRPPQHPPPPPPPPLPQQPYCRRIPEANDAEERKESISVQPTSVVDAIAQTMVGEWMWKYVRRRRSFGMTEQRDGVDVGKSTEEMSANISSSGTRHKRWVWIAPYERAIMWSNKQPTNGMALLGKSGRKLVIQSVLDVKDENPLPKAAGSQFNFNRSILILTPQRALKFTAMTVERHYIWLTALSFLSHSSPGLDDLASLPPVPQEEPASRPPAAALRRNPIRDSIRVAKGKTRPTPIPIPNQASNPTRSFASHPPVPEIPRDRLEAEGNDQFEAADPPNVPRFSSHTRKRSNTAPKPTQKQNPFRTFTSSNSNSNHVNGFGHHGPAPSTYSTTTAGSSDLYSPTSIMPGQQSGKSSFSRRTSEVSGGPPNFFDAVGTMRMEAFVDRPEAVRPPRGKRSHHAMRRKERNPWSQSPSITTEFRGSDDGSDVLFRNDDPFKGF